MPVSESSPSLAAPKASPSPLVADGPSQPLLSASLKGSHHSYHLTLVPGIAIAVTAVAVITLIVLIVLIRQKSRELDEPDNFGKPSSKTLAPCATWKFQEGKVLDVHICFVISFLSSDILKPAPYCCLTMLLVWGEGWCRFFVYVPKIQLQGDKKGNSGF